jgi:hypothetical protein
VWTVHCKKPVSQDFEPFVINRNDIDLNTGGEQIKNYSDHEKIPEVRTATERRASFITLKLSRNKYCNIMIFDVFLYLYILFF